MKKQITSLIILLTISISLFAQASWETVTSPINEDLVSVCFIDSQNGWILSNGGTLLNTTDGGMSWQTTDFDSGTFASVYFTDQDHGCIVGWQDSSFILLTTDGGQNWNYIEHLKTEHLNDVYFADGSTGWAVGIKNNVNCILATSDGGQTWNKQQSISVTDGELYSVNFRDAMSGVTCGYYGMFLITNSGGASWALDVNIPAYGQDMNSVFNWDAAKGCAVGTSGLALYTVNSWGQYLETTTNTTEDLNGVSAVIGTNKVWAVGDNGTIIYTPTYYLGWTIQGSGVTENLNSINMIDENDGWAVGDNGTILHYSLGSSVLEDDETVFVVYPNPSNGIVYVEFGKETRVVELDVFDITGKEINTKNSNFEGKEITIDMKGLPSGIYFLNINTVTHSITKKINLY